MERVVNGGPSNPGPVRVSGAIARAVCAASACGASRRTSRKALPRVSSDELIRCRVAPLLHQDRTAPPRRVRDGRAAPIGPTRRDPARMTDSSTARRISMNARIWLAYHPPANLWTDRHDSRQVHSRCKCRECRLTQEVRKISRQSRPSYISAFQAHYYVILARRSQVLTPSSVGNP